MKVERNGRDYTCTYEDVVVELRGVQRGPSGAMFAAVTVRTPDGTGVLGVTQGNYSDDRLRHGFAQQLARRNSGEAEVWDDRLLEVWTAVDIGTRGGGQGPAGPLPFQTAAAVATTQAEQVEWAATGLAAIGCITEVDAKVKVGKTTLALAMAKAIIEGKPLMDRPTKRGPVLYLTEERAPSFRAVLARVGLDGAQDLHILFRNDVRDMAWPDVVVGAVAYAQQVGAVGIVVDTIARWAGLKDDTENNAGAAAEALEPLEVAAASGLFVVILRHDRKSGGDVGDSGRGSSAFSGAADIVLALRRCDAPGHENRRSLMGLGRFDEVPTQLVIEFENGTYTALGDAIDVEQQEAMAKLLDVLPPFTQAPGPMIDDLLTSTGAKRSTLQRALEKLIADGRVRKHDGAGKTKRGHGFTLAQGGNDVPT